MNRAWLDYTGESTAEGLLANGWFRYIHPDDLPGYVEGMRRARSDWSRFEGDLRLRRDDGVYRWMHTTGMPSSDDVNRPHGYVSVSIDIEERKRAEQALAGEGRRKDEFLAMLAHELRNPLFPITNAVQVIQRSEIGDTRIAWAGRIIDRQARQLARLVDDLMDVARITSGKVVLGLEPIAVPALIEHARDQTQPQLDERQQRLAVTLPPDTQYVEGDVVRLTQVLGNLLANASKYSSAGAEITLEVSASGEDVVITVADQGVGISPEMLPRVFDLFSQEEQALGRSQGGLGIGLNVVQRLVRAHGGSVEARSRGRDCGSEFVVRLPQLRQPTPPATVPPSVGPDEAAGARRVLVIDDNVDGSETLALLLEHAGHIVRLAHDGATALDAAREFRPHVVLLDIGLPDTNGYEVARKLRGRGETARAMLVALTGYGQAEDQEKSRAAGFDVHLVKPTPVDDVLALIQKEADASASGPAGMQR
jgi:two-component system CheB/CheR fusion protein